MSNTSLKTFSMDNEKTKTAVAGGSIDFFHYLQERPRERFSRFEAYIYMVDKACSGYRPKNIEEKWVPAIGDGQFFTTKTELAADWHWHRATVRDFLSKLTEFGCLVMEEHLKGILCTMPRLVVTFNASVAICYNFDAMAKYTMYSWADGTLKPYQVERIIGQMERGAKAMLDGAVVSAYAEKQLEDITRMAVHYAIEAVIARHPGKLKAAGEMGCNASILEKRALEFFGGHLGGNWVALLLFLSEKTEVALDGLCDTLFHGRSEREAVYRRLYGEAAEIKAVPLEPVPDGSSAEGASPDEYSGESSAEDNGTVPSDKDSGTPGIASGSVSGPGTSPVPPKAAKPSIS